MRAARENRRHLMTRYFPVSLSVILTYRTYLQTVATNFQGLLFSVMKLSSGSEWQFEEVTGQTKLDVARGDRREGWTA